MNFEEKFNLDIENLKNDLAIENMYVTDDDISWYVENEKYLLNRAGYSIAGKTSIFVDKIVGDYYNILGMPISKLYSKLNELGYNISDFEMKD